MKHNNLLSSKEAAQILGLSPDHIRRLIKDGVLKGKKIGNSWVVLELNYRRKRRPKTRKKDKQGD
jgi:excisionase family DNA binding protein